MSLWRIFWLSIAPLPLPQLIVAVSLDQPLQHPDRLPHLGAALGVGYAARGVRFADYLDAGNDVHAIADGGLDRFEMMVQREERAICLQHQRVAVIAVGFGECAVDGDRLPAAL